MRGEGSTRDVTTRRLLAVMAAAWSAVVVVAIGALAAEPPRLVGPTPFAKAPAAPPFAKPITDDVRRMRAYPEQPPVIPHAIQGYQLTLTANRCLSCHRRQFVEGSGAPMISVTHFMDRDGQMLADVSPRRYFCLQCHVSQTDAKPLVDNTFVDMLGAQPRQGR
jgi:cytochrome c-type protein NapB